MVVGVPAVVGQGCTMLRMDELPSAEFRRVYSKLTKPTVVTVNGHPIGTYQPISVAMDSRALDAIRPGEPKTPTTERFNTRPFMPVPKRRG
jgi:hypothetical protein